MGNCKDCKHSKFDELWGQYKCLQRAVYLPILLDSSECKHYESKDKKKAEQTKPRS